MNLGITMVLGGLWHGASWNFAIWGGLHGLGLAVVRMWQTWKGSAKATGWLRIFYIVLTFHFVVCTWVYFRAPDFATASAIFGRIATGPWAFTNVTAGFWLILAIGFLAHYFPKKWYDFSLNLYVRAPFYAQAAALIALVAGLQYVVHTGAAPFIYEKF